MTIFGREGSIDKIKKSLNHNGVLALGMIEGHENNWKQDHKYNGLPRFIARYSMIELRKILSKFFGKIDIVRIQDPENNQRFYLHVLCQNIDVIDTDIAFKMASHLFDNFGELYEQRTIQGSIVITEEINFLKKLLYSSKKILDLGSGSGRDAEALQTQGFDVTCVDASDWNIGRCREKGFLSFNTKMQEIDLIFPKENFDAVWSNCALTNWLPIDDIYETFSAIKSIIIPYGFVFIGSVIGSRTGIEQDEKYGGLPRFNNHWDIAELRNLLECLGKIIYWRIEDARNQGKKKYAYAIIQIY